ncbi:MAG: hypothetical protein ACREC0_00490 [Methylocella sp.]
MNQTPLGLVNLTAAAKFLAQTGDNDDRSSLSRYIAKYSHTLTPRIVGRETVLDFETLLKHRRENIRLSSLATDAVLAGGRNRAEEGAANLRAQRRLRELDLSQREGRLVPKAAVENAARSAIVTLRSAFALAVIDVADKIAAATGTDSRVIRVHLREFEKIGLGRFAEDLANHGLTELDGAGFHDP